MRFRGCRRLFFVRPFRLTRDRAFPYVDHLRGEPEQKGEEGMNPRISFLIGVVALLLASGGHSFADEEHAAAAMAIFKAKFKEIDANVDGKISREEYEQYILEGAMERFDKADKDKDGYVTPAEAEEALKARAEEIREKMREWQQKRDELKEMKKPQQQKGDETEDGQLLP